MLRSEIESGTYVPGTRLPSENELSKSFNVSRTVIREAIWKLQVDGLVISRQGSGIYITSPSESIRSFRLGVESTRSKNSTRELYELRMGIENQVAYLAAMRRTKSDLALLEKQLKKLQSCDHNLERGSAADLRFHQLIAKFSKNNALHRFEDFLSAVLMEAVMLARQNSARSDGFTDGAMKEHVEIFEAIRHADPDRAHYAMRSHLSAAQKRLGLL